MDNVTLAIAGIGSLLVLFLRPSRAFAVYIAVLLFYPTYLVVTVGTIDISASRIVIAVLLAKLLTNENLRSRFKWCRLDGWVAVYMGITIVVMCITSPPAEALENRAGFLMDTFFAYLAARLCVTDRAALISVVKCVGVILVPLVIMGVLESAAGWRPYAQLRQYCPWRMDTTIKEARFGFERAEGPFGHAIMFGTAFAILLPCLWSLRHEGGCWPALSYLLTGAALIGALSSMSGGPWNTLIVVIFCLALERYKRWVKPLLIFMVFSCIFTEIASNRPFYHVILSYANPLGGAAGHRAVIVDCAIEDIDKWWMVGYRGQDPGWGPRLGMAFTDVTNEFVLAGVYYGILGVIGLCAIFTSAIQMLVRSYNLSNDPVVKSWCWALCTILVAVIITFMGVAFFGQIKTIFYCILGVVGSVPNLVAKKIMSSTKYEYKIVGIGHSMEECVVR
jgi:hypothetical protein